MMNFFGRYGEPSYSLKIDRLMLNREYLLNYSMKTRKWTATDKSKLTMPSLEESKDIKKD